MKKQILFSPGIKQKPTYVTSFVRFPEKDFFQEKLSVKDFLYIAFPFVFSFYKSTIPFLTGSRKKLKKPLISR
ncbi:MAG: hypothetical protein LUG18_15885 [Candidatus Azobacteroides sp.]|nr:hypothetical protein [Candidatus Azobacteroides sp.]